MLTTLRALYVRHIYADQNSSLPVKKTLGGLLESLAPGQVGLNVGSGGTRLHSQLRNLDIQAGPGVDYVGDVGNLPFADDSFDLVITQETLEHVRDPFRAMDEIARVMKKSALLYCQTPFIIGYHPGPTDYWRFTTEGIGRLVERAGLSVLDKQISVGGATGYYRISVEFWATVLSFNVRPVYKLMKAMFALLLMPIKFLDFVFNSSNEKDRIAGGYFVVAEKR